MESVYWVFTLRCNDRCDHCYNDSSPTGEHLPVDELLRVVPNLPAAPGRVILSGGEPTVEMDTLEALVGALRARYARAVPLMIQTNGDLLLAGDRLARLDALALDRVDVVSLDRFHKQQGRHRESLEAAFRDLGWQDASRARLEVRGARGAGGTAYAFWGATEDNWLQGNWARGRAMRTGTALLRPEHNFCALWSGALGFLDDGSEQQEVHVQLTRLYPCCPTTWFDLGDVREHTVEELLEAVRADPDWQALNRGAPAQLGAGALPEGLAARRIRELGDVCLWCDEFMRRHFAGPRGQERALEHRTPLDV